MADETELRESLTARQLPEMTLSTEDNPLTAPKLPPDNFSAAQRAQYRFSVTGNVISTSHPLSTPLLPPFPLPPPQPPHKPLLTPPSNRRRRRPRPRNRHRPPRTRRLGPRPLGPQPRRLLPRHKSAASKIPNPENNNASPGRAVGL